MHDVADMYGGWHACLVLSDRLVKATNRMDEALLRMRSLIGSGMRVLAPLPFQCDHRYGQHNDSPHDRVISSLCQ
jgi:hypothetical protein